MDPSPDRVSFPSRSFHPRVYGVGAWTDNLHFAYDLVATVKPRLFLELGTDRGESYFAFCQSVAENNTGTRCFAVDTWRGDEQAGGYDETTFREVSEHNAAHYAAFSTLLRCRFDDALARFAPESINLLHLDGLHTEAAVRHDVEAWLPKLRPGGIFLMHDVSVRTRGFGVWKIWEELRQRGRSYTFPNGPGLGVWQKPPTAATAEPLESLLSQTPATAEIAAYYAGCAEGLQKTIAGHWRDGTIADTAAGHQSIIQVFYTDDGAHREEDSVLARIGHEEWKEVALALPPGAGAAPLRIDFVSPFTVVDIAKIEVVHDGKVFFSAADAAAFNEIRVGGDATRLPHQDWLRLQITGYDPQLYLAPIDLPRDAVDTAVIIALRVSVDDSAAR